MASSLEQQLKALQNPEFTAGMGQGRAEGKLRASFLFDPRDAAKYDMDTMFNIGCNGFAELVQLNAKFAPFEQPLFSDAARGTDRVLLDAKVNAQLDRTIHGLLTLLSPYFHLKPAGKVLEWLIRRFRINEFNVQSVISCILPYYETKQFTQMVSTLVFDQCQEWAFLSRVHESGKPMDRLFFLRRLFTESELVTFVCESIKERVKRQVGYSTAFTFYTTTLVQYLTNLRVVDEGTVTLLMPHILHGIASENKEWRLSNYLVLCHLSSRIPLSGAALGKISSSIVRHAGDELPQAVLALLCLAQTQAEFPQIAPALVDLARHPAALAAVARSSNVYRSDRLLHSLVASACAQAEYGIIAKILSTPDLALARDHVVRVVEHVLEAMCGEKDDAASTDLETQVAPIFQRLQARYTEFLDEAIAQFVGKVPGNKKHAFRAVRQCLGGTFNALLEDVGMTLFLALVHPNDAFCLAAVCHAVQMLKADEKAALLAGMPASERKSLAESFVHAMDRSDIVIAKTILGSAKLVAFVCQECPAKFVTAAVQVGTAHPMPEAVQSVNAALAERRADLDATVRNDAQVFLAHVHVQHPDWNVKGKDAGRPDVGMIRKLLNSPAYALSGLQLVTSGNFGQLADKVVELIQDERRDVSNAAIAISVKSPSLEHRCDVFLAVLALPNDRLEEHKPLINDVLNMEEGLWWLCTGAQKENELVVERCLTYIAAQITHDLAVPRDYQVLLPHTMPCLLHESKAVRAKAVTALGAMLRNFSKADLSKKKHALKVIKPAGYSTEDILFAEPKVMHDWLELATAEDLASSPEAVLHLSYRKKRKQVLLALLSHLPHLQVPLLKKWLVLISKVDSPDVFLSLHMHFRQRHSELSSRSTSDEVDVIIQFIHCITPAVAPQILRDDSLETFKQFLNGYATSDLERVQQATLTRITPELWTSLEEKQQFELLYILLNIVSKSLVSDVVMEAKSVLKRIPLDAGLLVRMFVSFIKKAGGSNHGNPLGPNKRSTPGQNRQRMSKLTSLLELISYKEVAGNQLLIQPMFNTLQYILNHSNYSQYDYIIQLLLSDLLIVNKQGLDESAFRVDLLVTCIRSTDNPQTHNSVLLVLSSLAEICPDKVLLNVMPIFTFMGAHVLRQDDEYTFNVIESTIQKIIPSLLLNVKHIKHVIQVFADAIQHIPVHRRLRLFSTLIRTLGEQYLYVIIALLLEKEHVKLLEFCLLIASEFDVKAQLRAMIELVKVCSEDVEQETTAKKVQEAVADSRKKGGKDARRRQQQATKEDDDDRMISQASILAIRSPVLTFIDENLMLRSFISSLSKVRVESEVKEVIHALLVFIQRHETNKPLLRLAYSVLDKVHHLMSLSTFITVVSELWKDKSKLIQKRAVTMFNDRIGHLSAAAVEKYGRLMLDCLPSVRAIIAADKQDPDLLQLGLMSIQQLTIHFAFVPAHTPMFMDCVPAVLAHTTSANTAVRASALVCLSHMIAQMTQRTVKYLNQWMSPTLDFLASSSSVLGRVGALACLEQCIRHLHAFMSPFLPRIFACLFAARDEAGNTAHPQMDLLHSRTDMVASLVASHMQPRHVLPALFAYVAKLPENSAHTPYVATFMVHVVAALKKEDVKQYHGEIFAKFFLVLLDHSAYHSGVVAALGKLVMKLNEELFRPLYAQLLRWLREKPQRRARAFFHVVSDMFDLLKSILIGYAALAFDDALTVLRNACPAESMSSEEAVAAAIHALAAIDKCALYDTSKVIGGYLEALSEGIVASLAVPELAAPASRCLVQMAITVDEDSLRKTIHQKLLAATHADAYDSALDEECVLAGRQAAVRVVGDLFETIGEGYLVFLPETIPAIAECLEDEEMESSTTAAARQIEVVLGEPLQKYLQK